MSWPIALMESRSDEARGNTSPEKLGAKKLNLGFFMGFSVVWWGLGYRVGKNDGNCD
jgi:hypothetical protein